MNDDYVPRSAYDDSQRRGTEWRDKYHAEKAINDKRTIDDAVKEAISADDIDKPIVEGMLRGSRPRVVDGRPLIDFGPEDSMIGTPAEYVEYMRANPTQYGNIVGIQPKKEPSPREKHWTWLKGLTPEQFNAYRRKHGRGYLDPPTDQT